MLNRRELIAALLGCEVAMLGGCSRRNLPPAGELRSTNFRIGHRLRDGHRPRPVASAVKDIGMVIVGGGIAGLSAARKLLASGFNDFVLLELEEVAGGTARGGRTGSMAYPWGAHYVPVPLAENREFLALLDEMGVVEGYADDGSPRIAEQFLCRDPSERLFFDGRWHEGIYPFDDADADELRQLDEFRAEIDRWVAMRDDQGRRMFTIPLEFGSDAPEVRALDQISVAQWLSDHGWNSPRLRWYVDYACRDDYGLSVDQVSAWAGVFYFASRVRSPGQEAQSVITWPEGNARIVEHLAERVGPRFRGSMAVSEISAKTESGDELEVVAIDTRDQSVTGYRTPKVIFAAPQFLVPHLVRGFEPALVDRSGFQYGSWLVANVHLTERPRANGFAMSWDNVIYQSKSLGYVTSTHQTGLDHGPTVLTWYYPFADVPAKLTREKMLRLGWEDWADLVLSDLQVAHADIASLVSRIDIMCWGHAMVQPRVGFVWSDGRAAAAKPLGGIHFAGTDLSGVPLVEEAFYHGVRAADEAVGRGGDKERRRQGEEETRRGGEEETRRGGEEE